MKFFNGIRSLISDSSFDEAQRFLDRWASTTSFDDGFVVDVFNALLESKRLGCFTDLEKIRWDVIERQSPGAFLELAHEYSLCLIVQGQFQKSLEVLNNVLPANREVVWYARAGLAYLGLHHFHEALNHFTMAESLAPNNIDVLTNLAATLVRLQRLDEAVALYERILQKQPDHELATNARYAALQDLGNSESVIHDLLSKLALQPDSIETRLSLFHSYTRIGCDDEAVLIVTDVLQPYKEIPVQSDDVVTDSATATELDHQVLLRWALIEHFQTRQQWWKAIALLNQLRFMYKKPPLQVSLAWSEVAAECGEVDKGLQRLTELDSDFADDSDLSPERLSLINTRLRVLLAGQREPEALAIMKWLSVDVLESPLLVPTRAQVLISMGFVDDAALLLERVATEQPQAFIQMAHAKRLPESDMAIKVLTSIVGHPMHVIPVRVSAAYALAEVFDKLKQYDQAAHYLKMANEFEAPVIKYESAGFTQDVNNQISVFNHEWFASRPHLPGADPTPIFVVGMPRSGTTLTESILGSHPLVYAAGELGYIPKITRILPGVFEHENCPISYPEICVALSRDDYVDCANHYLHCLKEHTTSARFVVDKLPHNFVHLGFIHTIFPAGKIIHVRRDPRDVGLSNYQQNFGAKYGGMGYAFDLKHIAQQINDYHRLMNHWRDLGVPMFEFFYEDLVADQQGVSKQLLDYVGVEWDPGVLEFSNLERAVRTASVAQVRKPIYQTSRQKWLNYEKLLEPLLENLDPEVTAPWD